MRLLCTLEELERRGVSRGERKRSWRRIRHGVYGEGLDPPTALDQALAVLVATAGTAIGQLAGVLHDFDGVELLGPEVAVPSSSSGRRPGVRRRDLPADVVTIVAGYRCTTPLQTLIDLAHVLDDDRWEQALESALRKRLVTIAELAGCRSNRIRRVLARRPVGAPPTGSLLETLMVQLARRAGVPDPERQVAVYDRHDNLIAYVDLAWPDLGLFIELDGQQHKDQPVYDATRETAVVAATGWLCGRFTWHEVVDLPNTTARRLAGVIGQARNRPLAS
jgi:hypothetical protein